MFEKFKLPFRRTLYKSFLNSVRTNTGIGFHDGDQAHLIAYLRGKPGENKPVRHEDWPEYNELYIMMKELSESLKDCEDFGPKDHITCWEDFCKMAVEGHNKHPHGNIQPF